MVGVQVLSGKAVRIRTVSGTGPCSAWQSLWVSSDVWIFDGNIYALLVYAIEILSKTRQNLRFCIMYHAHVVGLFNVVERPPVSPKFLGSFKDHDVHADA